MSQPNVASTIAALQTAIEPSISLAGGSLVIRDEARLRSDGIRDLVWTATFTEDEPTRDAARWIVAKAASQLGCGSASIHELYMARGRGEIGGFTVPAINLRTQVFDMAAATFRAAAARDVGTVILELARSEQEYTYQRPGEYLTSVLAGAVAAAGPPRSSSRATTTSSTPRSTPPIRRPSPRVSAAWPGRLSPSATATSTSTAPPCRPVEGRSTSAARQLHPRGGDRQLIRSLQPPT
jgi:hypothetical protein